MTNRDAYQLINVLLEIPAPTETKLEHAKTQTLKNAKHFIEKYNEKIEDISNNNVFASNIGINNDVHNDSSTTPLNLLFENNEVELEVENKKQITGRLVNNNANNNSPREKQNISVNDLKTAPHGHYVIFGLRL